VEIAGVIAAEVVAMGSQGAVAVSRCRAAGDNAVLQNHCGALGDKDTAAFVTRCGISAEGGIVDGYPSYLIEDTAASGRMCAITAERCVDNGYAP
jgi:hypothetical protein